MQSLAAQSNEKLYRPKLVRDRRVLDQVPVTGHNVLGALMLGRKMDALDYEFEERHDG